MAIQLRTTLKGYFQSGNIPVEQHYIDIIDSSLSISESNSGNIDLTGNITASGNLSLGGSTSGSGDFITAGVTSSGHISASGALTASGINIFGNITASGNVKCGNFDVGGSVLFDNISLGGTALTTTFAELNYLDGLTSGEANQIKAIGSNAISNTEWSYVANNNQSVATATTPTFAGLILTKNDEGSAGNYGETISSNGASTQYSITNIPTISGASGGRIDHTAPTLIRNSSVTTTSTIIITCVDAQLIASPFDIRGAIEAGTAGYYVNLANALTTDFTDGVATFTALVI